MGTYAARDFENTHLSPLGEGKWDNSRKPNFWTDTLPAAFRQENLLIAGLEAIRMQNYGDYDESFNALDPELLHGTVFEADTSLLSALKGVKSRSHFEAIKVKLEGETRDRAVLQQSGGRGFLAAMAAGVLSPDVLIPGFGAARAGGHLLLRTAGRTAAAAMTGASAAEVVLQSTQYTRTPGESAFAITGAALFGATLGGFAHVISSSAKRAMGSELDRTLDLLGVDPKDVGPDGRLLIRAEDVDSPDPGIPHAAPGKPLTPEQAGFFGRVAAVLHPEELGRNALVAIDTVRNSTWAAGVRRMRYRHRLLAIRSQGDEATRQLEATVQRFDSGEADIDEVIVAMELAEDALAPQLIARTDRSQPRQVVPAYARIGEIEDAEVVPEPKAPLKKADERPLARHAVRSVPGIGPAFEAKLTGAGVHNLADLAEALDSGALEAVEGFGAKRRATLARHLESLADAQQKPVDLEGTNLDPVQVAWDRVLDEAVEAADPEDTAAAWVNGLDRASARHVLRHVTTHSPTAARVLLEGEEATEEFAAAVLAEVAEAPVPREVLIDMGTEMPERLAAIHEAQVSSPSARQVIADLTVRDQASSAGYALPIRHDDALSAALDEAAEKVEADAGRWRSIVAKNVAAVDDAEWNLIEKAGSDTEGLAEMRALSAEDRLDQAKGHLERLKRRRDVFHVERQVRVERYRALQKTAAKADSQTPALEGAIGALEAVTDRLVIPELKSAGGRPSRLPEQRFKIRADDPRARQLAEKPGAAHGVRILIAHKSEVRTAEGRTVFQPNKRNAFGAGTILRIKRLRGGATQADAQRAVVQAQTRLNSTRKATEELATRYEMEQIRLATEGVEVEQAEALGELKNLGLEDWEIDTLHESLSRAGQDLRSAKVRLDQAQEALKAAPRKTTKPEYMAEVVLDSPTTSPVQYEILRRIAIGDHLLSRAKKGTPRYKEIERKLEARWKAYRAEKVRLGIHKPAKEFKDPKTGKVKPARERQDIAEVGKSEESAVLWVPLKDLDVQLDGAGKPIKDDPAALAYVRQARMPIREGKLPAVERGLRAGEDIDVEGAKPTPVEGPLQEGEARVYNLPPQWRRVIGREVDVPPDPGKRYWRRETFAPEERAIAGHETQETISGFTEAEKARKDRPGQRPAAAYEEEKLISFEPSDVEGGRPTIKRGKGEVVERPMVAAASQTTSRPIDDPGLSFDPAYPRLRDVFTERTGQRTRLEMEDLLPSRAEELARHEDEADRWLGLPREQDLHPDVRKLRDMGDQVGALRLQSALLTDVNDEWAEQLAEHADYLEQTPRRLFAGEGDTGSTTVSRDPHIIQDTVDDTGHELRGRGQADDLDDYEYQQQRAMEMSDDADSGEGPGKGEEDDFNYYEHELRFFDLGKIGGGAGTSSAKASKNMIGRIANVAGLDPQGPLMSRMLRINLALRLSTSPSEGVRMLAQSLMDTGLWYADNLRGLANPASVFDQVRLKGAKLHHALEMTPKLYYKYMLRMKGQPAPKNLDDISIARARLAASWHSIREKKIGEGDLISYDQFIERIGIAGRRGDIDKLIPEVGEAARWIRKEILNPSLAELIALGKLPEGLRPDMALSYMMRLYNIRAIKERPHEFLQLATDHFVSKGETQKDAFRIAEEIMEGILAGPEGRLPYEAYKTRATRATKERVYDIADELLVENGFLDNNVETILRFYFRSVVPDIELMKLDKSMYSGTKRAEYIPDPKMEGVLKRIRGHYNQLIDAAEKQGRGKEARFLEGRMEKDITDLDVAIGRLRHTYGIPNDPNGLLPRAGIAFRAFNFLVDSGMFMLSSLPDVARPFMMFGVSRTFKHGIVPMVRDWQSFKLNAKEARLAGAAGEWAMARRGLSMFDFGDLYYGRGTKFERGLRRLSQEMAIFSGLVPWNTTMKQWVGTIVSQNIAEDIGTVMGAGAKLPQDLTDPVARAAMARLAKGTIDIDMAHRIYAELQKRPTVGKPGSELLDIGTDQWTDFAARDSFRIALARDVDLAIVTPGLGDKPNWMSKEMGRFMLQYKSFAFAATTRMLTLGLQKPDLAFWNGVGMSVGLGMASLYLKSTAANWPTPDITTEKGFWWWLRNGMDRSGVWGILGDVNNSVGIATRGGISAGRPFGGIDPGFRYTSRNILTEAVGPTASTIQDVGKVLEGVGDMAQWQAPSIASRNASKRLMPAQNHFALSRIYDRTFSAGHRGMINTLGLQRPKRRVTKRQRWTKSRQTGALQVEAVQSERQLQSGK